MKGVVVLGKHLKKIFFPSFRLKLGIIYDNEWFQFYGSHQESSNAARRVVDYGQKYFNMPSLTVRVKLQIVSITYKSVQLDPGNKGL
jgi:hypothetical protein